MYPTGPEREAADEIDRLTAEGGIMREALEHIVKVSDEGDYAHEIAAVALSTASGRLPRNLLPAVPVPGKSN